MNNHQSEPQRCTVYYDGACPLCSREIAIYQKWKGGEQMNWVDASQCDQEQLGEYLTREQALARLHCRDEGGNLLEGAQAFIAIWSRLRGLTYLTPLLSNSVILKVLECAYRGFLHIRRRLYEHQSRANS
jgi:predicted DCC family thiol-disulfide oxidoreductase YuxK